MTLKDGKTAFLCDFKDLTDRRYIAERIVLPLLTADRVDDLERVVQTTAVKAETDLAKLREGALREHACRAGGKGVWIVPARPTRDGGRDIQSRTATIDAPAARARDLPRTTRKTSRPSGASSAMRRWRSGIRRQRADVHPRRSGVHQRGGQRGRRGRPAEKLEGLNAMGVVDSANLEMLLSGRMLFPVFGSTEKVDKVASSCWPAAWPCSWTARCPSY